MTNNTLKSTIEAIRATSALIVVTLDGTFNSQTGVPVLSARTRADQRNKFLKEFCDRVAGDDVKDANETLRERINNAEAEAALMLDQSKYDAAIEQILLAKEASEQLDQPRVYYRLKETIDLRTVAEKRAARKAENEAKRAEKAATKAAKAADKMAAKIAQNATEPVAEPVSEPVATTEHAKPAKGGKKTA